MLRKILDRLTFARVMTAWVCLHGLVAGIACYDTVSVRFVQQTAGDGGAYNASDFATTGRKLGDFTAPTPRSFAYTSGAGDGGYATYTVPALNYITGIAAHSTSGGTLTIGTTGVGGTDGAAGATITIPANSGWSLPSPIPGNLYNLGPGAILTFTGIDAYYVSLTTFGGN
jgi:hypothetical protein